MQKEPARGVSTHSRDVTFRAGTILAAACALPGIAAAEGAPTEGLVGFKYLYYKDSQPSLDRITVSSPSLYGLVPIGSSWSIEGSFVIDSVSGPSPRYHTAVSSASKMEDSRTAWDLKVVRYFRRAAIGVGFAKSSEDDYTSNANNLDLRFSTDDNNTTFTVGYGETKDTINPTGGGVAGVVSDRKNVYDYLVGVTHVLTANDVMKLNYTQSRGKGYFSDPYKAFDDRPRIRNTTVVLLQWNHYFEALNGTLRTTFRNYSDSYNVQARTLGFEYAQELGATLVLTPALRYHTQSAAFFYYDPTGQIPPLPPGFPATRFSSPDQRLSAFGGITVGFKVAKTFGLYTTDFRYDYLQQKADWRAGGKGSPGLEPFTAHFIQFGIARKF